MASQAEAEDVFAEDFPFHLPNPANSDPWAPCPVAENGEKKSDFLELTSERYIASLEAKLNRIQGKAKRDPTSKDLIQGLEKAKDAHMTVLVQSSDQPYLSNYIPEKDNVQNPNILQRKLHPEKIAISGEERKLLVEDDDLAKRKAAVVEAAKAEEAARRKNSVPDRSAVFDSGEHRTENSTLNEADTATKGVSDA